MQNAYDLIYGTITNFNFEFRNESKEYVHITVLKTNVTNSE